MKTPKDELHEIARRYPQAINYLLTSLFERYAREPLVGDTSDETLRRTYGFEYRKRTLEDIKKEFGYL